MEEQEKRLSDFHMEQEAIKQRAADRHAEEKKLREEQVKRLQVLLAGVFLVAYMQQGARCETVRHPLFSRNRNDNILEAGCHKPNSA